MKEKQTLGSGCYRLFVFACFAQEMSRLDGIICHAIHYLWIMFVISKYGSDSVEQLHLPHVADIFKYDVIVFSYFNPVFPGTLYHF